MSVFLIVISLLGLFLILFYANERVDAVDKWIYYWIAAAWSGCTLFGGLAMLGAQ